MISVGTIAMPVLPGRDLRVAGLRGELNWLPAIGAGEQGHPLDQLAHLVLPSFAVGLGWVGYLARIVRASMLEVMGENHVRTPPRLRPAERRIVFRYALQGRHPADRDPARLGFGTLLSGAVFAEIIFSRPGIGKLIYDAVSSPQLSPSSRAACSSPTMLYIVVLLVADLVVAWLDPRVRQVALSSAARCADARARSAASALRRLCQLLRDRLGLLGLVLVVLIC